MMTIEKVKVGDRLRLLPDDQLPGDITEHALYPNSTLRIPFNWPLVVAEVKMSGGLQIVRVEGSFRGLDSRRFAPALIPLLRGDEDLERDRQALKAESA
ncbi:hypothetical protein CcrColossus_gp395 [Caulobacter phage CcrColossus]|uniref:Uncharacterized protein n=1 Tax=Caulobacter phage CcrColossus TaxID=1211640 RepID=K4JV73_9CAUD|nr:hypothetical protein CcrColossus_gp395 [Caulobacter phage CcrColossus]AFU88265.1 hypothetical protein CcrColossus_gp395 [Caulobacter phage CcrColossus]